MSTASITAASAGPSSQDSEITPDYASAFNFFFLLIPVVGIIIFSFVVYFSRCRLKYNNARPERTGHDAQMQNAESRFRSNGIRGITSAHRSPGYARRFQFLALNPRGSGDNSVVDEEASLGLDERGEAPPPYRAYKSPSMISRTCLVQSEEEARLGAGTMDGGGYGVQNTTAQRPPDYDQVVGLVDGTSTGALTRPTPAVRPMERVIDVALDG